MQNFTDTNSAFADVTLCPLRRALHTCTCVRYASPSSSSFLSVRCFALTRSAQTMKSLTVTSFILAVLPLTLATQWQVSSTYNNSECSGEPNFVFVGSPAITKNTSCNGNAGVYQLVCFSACHFSSSCSIFRVAFSASTQRADAAHTSATVFTESRYSHVMRALCAC